MDIKNLLRLAGKTDLDFGQCVKMFSYLAENNLSINVLPKEARKSASRIFLMSIAKSEPKGSYYRRTAVNLLKDIMVVQS